MDVKTLKQQLTNTNDALSATIDGLVKSRSTKGLRSLISAGEHIEKAEKLIDKAVEQAKPVQPKASK